MVAMSLAGCTSNQDSAGSHSRTSPPPSASLPTKSSTSGRSEHIPGETVTKAPVLPDGEVLAQTANAHGNQELEIPGGIKAGPLAILVNCQGEGTLTVSVKPVGLSFPLECVNGEVSSTFNQLNLKKSRTYGTVDVTAPSHVRWALSVGQ